MCFSVNASFTLSAILFSTGTFSTIKATNANKNYLFLALIPLVFGIQQGIEGMIWWQLSANPFSGSSFWIYFYLFFAFCFWPAYIPFCTYRIEKKTIRKKILMTFMIAGTILGVIIYTPLLLGLISVNATIIGHCIRYHVNQAEMLSWFYTTCYLFIVTMSLLLSSIPKINLLGIVTLISAISAYWWYFHAFTSIWCFFAAVISIYIANIMYRLPRTIEEGLGITVKRF